MQTQPAIIWAMDQDAKKQALLKAWTDAATSGAPLSEQLDRYARASRQIIPDVLACYDRMVARLMQGEAGIAAPAVGDEMPDALLPDSGGHLVGLSTLWANGPLVVSFNRGHWCPYCRLELHALKEAAAQIETTGAQLVSVVPETAEFSSKMIETNVLPFRVLSDMDLAYALELGLTVWTGPEIHAIYAPLGIDLARFQGNESSMLPIPATFVIATGGRVAARFVDSEFRRRMPIEDILTALTGLGQSQT